MVINSVFDITNIEVNFYISDEMYYKIDEMHKIDEIHGNNLTNVFFPFLLFRLIRCFVRKKTIKN
jgi:hypothetical protein